MLDGRAGRTYSRLSASFWLVTVFCFAQCGMSRRSQADHTAMIIHPATKLSGVGLGGASMEAEASASQSGERVLAMITDLCSTLDLLFSFDERAGARELFEITR